MPFAPIDDISDIEASGLHVRTVDAAMVKVVAAVRFAIREPSNLKRHSRDDKDLVQLLRDQLTVFVTTHQSIRRLFRYAHRQRDYPPVADGISLAREQVEKIFTIALLFQNPPKWIKIYLRSDYRKKHEEWLLLKEELGHLPRHHHQLNEVYPAFLEKYRRASAATQSQDIFVSRFAIRVLEHYWNNPGDKKPPWTEATLKSMNLAEEKGDKLNWVTLGSLPIGTGANLGNHSQTRMAGRSTKTHV